MPDVAVATMLVDARDDVFDSVDLVRAHHEQLLLAGHQHHVAADHLPQRALGQEGIGKWFQSGDLRVVLIGELVDGQVALVSVEAEVPRVVVGEVVRRVTIADHEHLHEAEQRPCEAVARIVLVLDDLLDGAPRVDAEGLQLDLHHRNAVDQQDDVVAVVAVVGIDPQLVDDLEGVFAPVVDVHQRVVERRAILAREAVAAAKRLRRRKHILRRDLVEQPLELGVSESHSIERLELRPEIRFQLGTVTDIGAIAVLQFLQPGDQLLFQDAF